MKTVGIILSGGSGKRVGGKVAKQYIEIAGKPLLYYPLKTFEESFIDEIVLVVRSGDEAFVEDEIVKKYGFNKVTKIVTGGKERYHSVAAGLEACIECDYVFIHDGARAFVTEEVLEDAFEAVKIHGAVVAAVPSKDTVKIADEDGFVAGTPNRESVYIMQTPQAFEYSAIKDCYRKLIENEDKLIADGIKITDDAMVMEQFGDKKVFLSRGDYKNMKVTTPEDIEIGKLYVRSVSEE